MDVEEERRRLRQRDILLWGRSSWFAGLVSSTYSHSLIYKECEFLGKHKFPVSVSFLLLELISLLLDLYGKNKKGVDIAAFILSAISFLLTFLTYIVERATMVTTFMAQKQLTWLEFGFSAFQFIFTFLEVLGIKIMDNHKASALTLFFAFIAAVYAFKKEKERSESSWLANDASSSIELTHITIGVTPNETHEHWQIASYTSNANDDIGNLRAFLRRLITMNIWILQELLIGILMNRRILQVVLLMRLMNIGILQVLLLKLMTTLILQVFLVRLMSIWILQIYLVRLMSIWTLQVYLMRYFSIWILQVYLVSLMSIWIIQVLLVRLVSFRILQVYLVRLMSIWIMQVLFVRLVNFRILQALLIRLMLSIYILQVVLVSFMNRCIWQVLLLRSMNISLRIGEHLDIASTPNEINQYLDIASSDLNEIDEHLDVASSPNELEIEEHLHIPSTPSDQIELMTRLSTAVGNHVNTVRHKAFIRLVKKLNPLQKVVLGIPFLLNVFGKKRSVEQWGRLLILAVAGISALL